MLYRPIFPHNLHIARSSFLIVGLVLEINRIRLQYIEYWFQGSGLRAQGSGFSIDGSGFRVQVSGFRFPGSGLRVQVSGFRF